MRGDNKSEKRQAEPSRDAKQETNNDELGPALYTQGDVPEKRVERKLEEEKCDGSPR